MGKILSEKNGTRKFERISRWNKIEEIPITEKSNNAQYAEPSSIGGAKLMLKHIERYSVIYPIKRFEKLSEPIILDDLTKIVMIDNSVNMLLEMNSSKDKVRLYQEIGG